MVQVRSGSVCSGSGVSRTEGRNMLCVDGWSGPVKIIGRLNVLWGRGLISVGCSYVGVCELEPLYACEIVNAWRLNSDI